jgi:hypothetical protein
MRDEHVFDEYGPANGKIPVGDEFEDELEDDEPDFDSAAATRQVVHVTSQSYTPRDVSGK